MARSEQMLIKVNSEGDEKEEEGRGGRGERVARRR